MAHRTWTDENGVRRISGRGIKKGSLYTADPDGAILSRLSKAALLDIATTQLRLNAGHCDTPCTPEELAPMIVPDLRAREDDIPSELRGLPT